MTFAPWTTARGVLEAASAAMWLLEDVDAKTRMARSLSLRLQHLDDEAVYVRDASTRHPDVPGFVDALPNIEARVEHLKKQAARLGIREKKDRRGRLIGFGEGLLNITELAENQLGERETFRLLSAVAHGRTWANLALGLRRLPAEGKIAVEQHLSEEAALFLIVSALDWFARPVWAYFEFSGWDLTRLADKFEQIYDQAGLVGTTRFWRNGSRF